MKKNELLKIMDGELMDKLFGFCYGRTKDSIEAGELCSDIVFALVKAANGEGEIDNPYPFIWRVARNVYAEFSHNRRVKADKQYEGDPDDVLPFVSDPESEDLLDEEGEADRELLKAVYRQIAFLTQAYREVMIMFYLDGLSTSEIALLLGTTEVNVRQRLFSARKKIRNEVETMTELSNKPVAFDKIDYDIIGKGNPLTGDPRDGFERQLSKQVLRLCHKKPSTAKEVADELNIPTMYVEEELEILTRGSNGEYGLLRRLENGKYGVNFVLLDKNQINEAQAIYIDKIPEIIKIIIDFIEKNRDEYLAFPYLNKKKDLNLIIWQQLMSITWAFECNVQRVLREKYFGDEKIPQRPFTVYGHEDNGTWYGCGNDDIGARNICGYTHVQFSNMYMKYIKRHFSCGHNIGGDILLQLALLAIDGLDIIEMSEHDKEYAAKAVECGYLYREGNKVYTKILIHDMKDSNRFFDISNRLAEGYFEEKAEGMAEKVAKLTKKVLPDYLMGEWEKVNRLAGIPLLDLLAEELINKGIIIAPKDGIGAEGCWGMVSRDTDITV